jgi:hypothetical protein
VNVCDFPGCERVPNHGGYHGYWNPDARGFVPLAEQRTPAEQMRDRREKINREKAEQIAGEVAAAGWDRDTENGTDGPERAMRYRLRSDAARAAALAALAERGAP